MQLGHVEEIDMYNTFNMGIGMVMAVEAKDADAVVSYLKEKGEDAYKIGVVSDKLPDDGMTRGTLTVR
jgi:phosphoribosylformylglycinamidine cyclo-ligase